MLRVEYFGHVRELVGKDFENMDVSNNGIRVDEVLERLRLPVAVICAINLDYCSLETVAKAGDSLCIMSPVSGG